jgi:CRP-like cAMP-binding protein
MTARCGLAAPVPLTYIKRYARRMASESLGPAERAAFIAQLRRISELSDADLAILSSARLRRLARGEVFLAAGDRAVDAGNVLAGVLRELYPLADGREVTRHFSGPGDGVGSLSDLISGEASCSTIVAETDARIVTLPWRTLRAEADRNPAWSTLLARTTERLYVLKARREYELLALDAEARYLRFRERFAAIEDLIALRTVASYVGITPEHLSRLRRRLSDKRQDP